MGNSRSRKVNTNKQPSNMADKVQGDTYFNDEFVTRAAKLGVPFTDVFDDEPRSSPIGGASEEKSPWGAIVWQAFIILAIVIAGGFLLYWLMIRPLQQDMDSLLGAAPAEVTSSTDNTETGSGVLTEGDPITTKDPIVEQSSQPAIDRLQISPSPEQLGEIQADGRTLTFLVGLIDAEGNPYVKPTAITADVQGEGGNGSFQIASQDTINGISLFSYRVGNMPGQVTLTFSAEGKGMPVTFDVLPMPIGAIELDFSDDLPLVADGSTTKELLIRLTDVNGNRFEGRSDVVVEHNQPELLAGLPTQQTYTVENGELILTIPAVSNLALPVSAQFTVRSGDQIEGRFLEIILPPPDIQGQLGGLCKTTKETSLSVSGGWAFGQIPDGYFVSCNPELRDVNGYVLVTIPVWVPNEASINGEILTNSNVVLFGLENAEGERTITKNNVAKVDRGNAGYWEEGRFNDVRTHILVFLTGYVLKADVEVVESGN